MPDRFGFEGDGFGEERINPANFPSLPGDGDPLLHEPAAPGSERHGSWDVYNPSKQEIDIEGVNELVIKHEGLSAPLTEEEARVLEEFEKDLRDD